VQPDGGQNRQGLTHGETGGQRKAEFFAAMKRVIQLGALLPKPGSLDHADAAGIAEAELVLAEMRKVQAELDAMMEYERKLRDLQPGN
jgi:hypothetical protein